MEKNKDNRLVIIVKIEKYIEYMLTILLKLPRTEKFSIGTEVRTSMYEMLKNILLASKIDICVLFYFFVLLIHFANSFGVISLFRYLAFIIAPSFLYFSNLIIAVSVP